jgi:hypothetical protein
MAVVGRSRAFVRAIGGDRYTNDRAIEFHFA